MRTGPNRLPFPLSTASAKALTMSPASVRLGAAFAALLLAAPLAAQQPTPAGSPPPAADAPAPDDVPALPPIDPDAPMAPLPETIETGAAPAGTGDETLPSLRYRTVVSGFENAGIAADYKALSELEKNDDIETLAQLDRRARDDVSLIDRLLRSHGYYAAQIDLRVDRPGGNDARAVVTIKVDPGPLYTLSSVEVRTPPGAPRQLILDTFSLSTGAPVDAAAIEAAEARLSTGLPEHGYPFALVGERDITVDHATRSATYRVGVTTGKQARVRQIRVEGARLVGRKQTARLARTRPGALYDSRDVEDLRRALVATGLFGSVAVRAVPVAAADDGTAQVDIVATTEAAPLHTVAGQAGYSTGEGIRLEASWQDRRFVEPEGALTVRGVAGTREQRAASELRFSNWRARDRTLLLTAEAAHVDQDAYQAKTLTLAASLARETNLIWQKKWFWSLGAELVYTDETDTDLNRRLSRTRSFGIAALPSSLNYDGTDSLLDPTRGHRLSIRASPEASLQNGAFGYLKTQIDGSLYLPVGGKVVAAGRVRLGSIFGAGRDRIAPSRRFYAGGGGSVRGFGYQDIGPKDPFNDPIGGRSLAEAAAELRVRAFGDFGFVAFVDAGQLYTSTLPGFDRFRIGVGAGVRYYSSFGPIRVDLATPLDPKRGDPKVAIYVSIGQAF